MSQLPETAEGSLSLFNGLHFCFSLQNCCLVDNLFFFFQNLNGFPVPAVLLILGFAKIFENFCAANLVRNS